MTQTLITRVVAPTVTVLVGIAVAGCGGSSSSSSSAATTSASSAQSSSASAAPSSASGGAAPAPATGAKEVALSIANYAYKPVSLTVKAGTKLVFTNHDSTAHTATSTSPALDTGTIKPGASSGVTVTKAGTYNYICQFHAFMHGTVTVTG